MKKAVIALLIGMIALAGCQARRSLTYDVSLTLPDESRSLELMNATERVVNRRMHSLTVDGSAAIIPTSKDKGKLKISVHDGASGKRVSDMLAQPFSFDVRVSKENARAASQQNSSSRGTDTWLPTGITGAELQWVSPIGDRTTGKIGVEFTFSPAGQQKLADVVRKNAGKSLGMFVRGLLVTKVSIEAKKIQQHIVVIGIPSPEIANVFTDDVNVGLHARLTPVEQ